MINPFNEFDKQNDLYFSILDNYYEKIFSIKISEKTDEALKVVEEGINETNSNWLKCIKAEILEIQGNNDYAYKIYYSLIEEDDIFLKTHVYLQLIQLNKKIYMDAKGIYDLCQMFFLKNKSLPITAHPSLYLIYILLIESLISLNKFDKAKDVVSSLENHQCIESTYVKVYYLYKINNDDGAVNLYKPVISNNFNHSDRYNFIGYQTEGKVEKNELKNIFFTSIEDDIYTTKLSIQYDNVRNELSFENAYPNYSPYSVIIQINDGHINNFRELYSIYKIKLGSIVSFFTGDKKKSICKADKSYLEIYQHSDRWYGAYENLYQFIRMMSLYLEDAYFFISEDYNEWLDRYQIISGKLIYQRYMAENDYWDSKLKVIEYLALNEENKYLKKLVSNISCGYAELDIKGEYKKKLSEKKRNTLSNKIKLVEKALKFDPENNKAIFLFGKASYYLSKFDEAKKYLVKLDQDDEYYKEALYILGNIALYEEYDKNALLYFNKLVEIDKKNINALLKLQSIYKKNKDIKNFELTNQKLCLIYTYKNNEIKINDKISSYEMSHLNQNLQSLQEKLKSNPNDIELNIQKGHTLSNMRKYNDAIEAYEKALVLQPNNLQVLLWQAAMHALKENRDLDKSISLLKEALKINPESVEALSDMGSALIESKKYDEASIYLEKAIKLKKDYYHPYFCKACLFSIRGDIENALKMLKKAIKLKPDEKTKIRLDKDFENLYNDIRFWEIML